VVLLFANVTQLYGTILTYDFSGTFNGNSFGPILTGTPFTGSFSIDMSAPGVIEAPPGQAYTNYLNSVSVEFTVPAVGLSTISSQSLSGSATIGHSTLPVGSSHDDTLSLSFLIDTFSGIGWS